MPIVPLLLSLAVAAAGPLPDRPITVTGHAWAPFISPMGEPFRARGVTDDTLARWFAQADRDQDGLLTAGEMQVDADRFFSTLDSNRDGEIDPTEMVNYEWEIAPDIQVMAKTRRTPGEAAPAREVRDQERESDRQRLRRVREQDATALGIDGALQGAARYGLLNIPQPVAAADSDFNRGVTRSEFQQAAAARFQLLDTARSGRLTLPALAVLRSAVLAGAKRKRKADSPDNRVAIPLPRG